MLYVQELQQRGQYLALNGSMTTPRYKRRWNYCMWRGRRAERCGFFFSSRRRHTRFDCDWSSDVCSSDLARSGARPRPARARESSRAEESRGPQREDDGHRREDREHREAGEQDLAERVEQAHQQAAEQRALEAAEAADDDDDEGEQQDLEIGAGIDADDRPADDPAERDRKSTRLNSSHSQISYAVFCLKKK